MSTHFSIIRTTSAALVRWFAFLLILGVSANAFPPAPYYTLYGMVRDQAGNVLRADGAQILLMQGTAVIARTPIMNDVKLDSNYELKIRVDQARPGSTDYSAIALAQNEAFTLRVEINGTRFYPIEITGNLTVGQPGALVRLDLTLGEDLDGDGLPDAWEESQLYWAGIYPGVNGWDLSLLGRNGDFDNDGISNYLEYLAGTYATDSTETFMLNIKEKSATEVRLEMFSVTSKTYTIERTTDLKTWERVSFSALSGGVRAQTYTGTEVGIMNVFITPSTSPNEFYRLTVR